MNGGSSPKSIRLADLVHLPWSISFGNPPTPVDGNHRLIHLAVRHVGGSVEDWGAREWELAARYLAHALEIAVTRALQLAESSPFMLKRPRGRPRKASRGITLNELLFDLVSSKQKHKRGRPRKITNEDWQNVYDMVNWYRYELKNKSCSARITDKAAITHLAKTVAKENGHSQEEVRRFVPKMQKMYSESKKRVGKILKYT